MKHKCDCGWEGDEKESVNEFGYILLVCPECGKADGFQEEAKENKEQFPPCPNKGGRGMRVFELCRTVGDGAGLGFDLLLGSGIHGR